MTDPLTLPDRADTRTVWVFALDVPPDELPSWIPPKTLEQAQSEWPMLAALGVDQVIAQHVEVFEVEDLAGVGLASYLSDAHGMTLGADAAHLEHLTGAVALVFASALPASSGRLSPSKPLRFVARLENPFDLAPVTPLTFPAQGTIAPIAASEPMRFPWRILTCTAGALLALALILWTLL
ncbi:MAG: hypothetical protein ACRBCL_04420 [Maritimibacter sp.]